ncbi:ATP-binding protein [Nocardia sp. NPDC127579]|uniref:ATP-binding protein n=1 Tax=Nocardia sp. NPDC127579 TaxID=3345402 RepID=UPI00362BA576
MDEQLSEAATRTTTIGVRVPAEIEQLTMLRALAETVTLIADFGIDEVTDIRLALDEIATALMLGAVPGSQIDATFTYQGGAISVEVSGVAADDTALDRGNFGWHIVQTLTDTLSVAQTGYDATVSGYPTVVVFTWLRGGASDER